MVEMDKCGFYFGRNGMLFCRFCGAKAPDDASFCGRCGQALTIIPAEGQTKISSPLREDSASLDDPTIYSAPLSVPPTSDKEDHEQKRRTLPPIVPIPEQPAIGDVPIVRGTPQVGSVPSVPPTMASTAAKAGIWAVAKLLIVAASCAVVIAGSIKILPIVFHGGNSNSPVVSTSPITKHHTPTAVPSSPTTVPMPPTQTSCPPTGTARAAIMKLLVLGTHQNLVYIDNGQNPQAPGLATLKRYDVTTGQTAEIANLTHTSISDAQISADGQWVLFVSQISGQAAIQIIRMDGQGLQTLHCASATQSIFGVSWSPDQQLLAFNEGVNIYTSSSDSSPYTYLLNILSGTLQTALIQPPRGPNQYSFINYIPSFWVDNMHFYLQEYVRCCRDNPFGDLYLLDTIKGMPQQASSLILVTKVSGGDYGGFELDPERTHLFLSQCTCGFPSGAGPSSITVQPATGGSQSTIYSSTTSAIIGIYMITNTRLLMLIESYANAILSIDRSQNGLWTINTDGTGLKRLTTEKNVERTILNASTPYPWSNTSRDENMYAAQKFECVSNPCASETATLVIGSLNGNLPTLNIATTTISGPLDSPLAVVGWTTM